MFWNKIFLRTSYPDCLALARFQKQLFSVKNSGQTMVEYILLLAVVAVLFGSVFRSKLFTAYFGEQGSFAKVYKNKLEYSYRHGLDGNITTTINPTDKNHDTYFKNGDTRFFGPKVTYP